MTLQHQAFLIAIYLAGGIALFRALLAQRRKRPMNPEAEALEARSALRKQAALKAASELLR